MNELSFTSPRTLEKIHAPLNTSLACDTGRNYDLCNCLLDALMDTACYAQLVVSHAIPCYAMEDSDADYWNSDECTFLIDELFDEMNSHAPEGYYFGAHGDGADFGYWEVVCD